MEPVKNDPITPVDPEPITTGTGNDDNVIIDPGNAAPNAAGSTAEDALAEYKALIDTMKQQNEALINQNKALQDQFSVLVRNGAGVASQPEPKQPEPPQEPYVPLAALGAEIGTRDYHSHNTKEQ